MSRAAAKLGLDALFTRTAGHRRAKFGVILAAVIVVPLAVAGFFAGALANADQNLESIPAIVVNNDALVNTTLSDGSEQPVFAGRQLVTELTGTAQAGFAWSVSNTEDAQKALAAGNAFAVLTIPKDFSKSINSLAGSAPKQAELSIRTDDSHGYLAGSVAQSVGDAMTTTFGRAITSQYLASFYNGLSGIGDSLTTAATGAEELSTGAGSLSTGLGSLTDGARAASSGAASLASGLSSYTSGVDALSTGLEKLNHGASDLSGLSAGVGAYTNAVGQTSEGFASLKDSLLQNPANEPYREALETLGQGLQKLTTQGTTLSSSTSSAVSGIQEGIDRSAAGADQLSQNSSPMRSGAEELAAGTGKLADGASTSAAGAASLATGAGKLSSGLESGAKQATGIGGKDAAATAKAVAQPVTVKVSTDNKISSVGQVIGMIFVPISLWIGAIAIFLALRPSSSTALASTASTSRLVGRGIARALAIAAAQAIVLIALLHTALGVGWTLLPQTLPFALLLAAVFTAFHYFLSAALGRAGVVVSIVLLALQVTSTAGLYPIQLLAAPFQAISPLLPLTYGVQGMQAIISGAGGGSVAAAAGALALFGLASVALSLWIVVKKRGVRSFGYALAGR